MLVSNESTRPLGSRRSELGLSVEFNPAGGDPVEFQAYHGVSTAEHQARVTELSAQGYGMISLSVYGDPNDAQYAAVWVNRPMPRWEAVHGVNASEYQTWFNTWSAQGYASELVSAAG